MDVTGIVGTLNRVIVPPASREHAWVSTVAPKPRIIPVVRISIVAIVVLLVLAGDGLVYVDAWAILNLVHRQREVKTLACPVDFAKGNGRDEHAAPIE